MFYHCGDKAEYTGTQQMLHGEMCYECTWLDGRSKGKKFWTYRNPESKTLPKRRYSGV